MDLSSEAVIDLVEMGAKRAMDAATKQNDGWESFMMIVLVAIILIVGACIFVGMALWIRSTIKTLMSAAEVREKENAEAGIKREAITQAKMDSLDNFVREKLISQLESSEKAMLTVYAGVEKFSDVNTALVNQLQTTRPCFWSPEKQDQVLTIAAQRIADSLIRLINDKVAEARSQKANSASAA
jgi:hypothetical protein